MALYNPSTKLNGWLENMLNIAWTRRRGIWLKLKHCTVITCILLILCHKLCPTMPGVLTDTWNCCLDVQKSVWYSAQRTADPHSANEAKFHEGSVVWDSAARSWYVSCCYWNETTRCLSAQCVHWVQWRIAVAVWLFGRRLYGGLP